MLNEVNVQRHGEVTFPPGIIASGTGGETWMEKGAEGEHAQAQIAARDAELKSERAQFALAERAARVGYWRLRLAADR